MSQKFHSWVFFQRKQTPIWKDICTFKYILALFIIAKIWKQPKCPAIDEWIKMWCVYMCVCVCMGVYKMEYYSAIWDNMDEPREYYAEWNRSERKANAAWVHQYVESKTQNNIKQK